MKFLSSLRISCAFQKDISIPATTEMQPLLNINISLQYEEEKKDNLKIQQFSFKIMPFRNKKTP